MGRIMKFYSSEYYKNFFSIFDFNLFNSTSKNIAFNLQCKIECNVYKASKYNQKKDKRFFKRIRTINMSYFGLENISKVISIDNVLKKEKNISYFSKSCQELTYTETLMAIRCDRVAEIKWFKNHNGHPWEPEGNCLVVLHDGTIRQSYVSINNIRAWFIFENHSVETEIMSIQWENGVNSLITASPKIMNQIRIIAPILGVGIIFAVTQWVV